MLNRLPAQDRPAPQTRRIFVQVILIWLALIASKFSANHYFANEVDVLPSARQLVERHWLPNDWYLNLDFGYRQPFNMLFGPLISWLGFKDGAFTGRLLIYLLFAVAFCVFCRAFRIRPLFGVLALLFFLDNQSIVAREWMIGGIETKTIAYVFVILSCAAFHRRHYTKGFVFAGAALSFHVLIGLYALFCVAVALLANHDKYRADWQTIGQRSWIFLTTGLYGLLAIYDQFSAQKSVNASQAWEIYVKYRNPHHLFPESWSGHRWQYEIVLAACFFLAVFLIGRSRRARFIASYAFGSMLLFLFGLGAFAFGQIPLLRYYWFRFPDVMAPFMGCVLGASILDDLVRHHLPFSPLLRLPPPLLNRIRMWLKKAAPVILAATVGLISLNLSLHLLVGLQEPDVNQTSEQALPMLRWIAEHTPRDAIFLIDPTMESFYVYAQRATFVSFKHVPHSEADILEWYRRIKLCNDNRDPEEAGFHSLDELRSNFYRLNEESIRRIVRAYGISYYLGLTQQALTFERVHSNNGYTLYKVDASAP